MVNVNVPGERWEVEFFDDGSVEVERFVTTGALSDASALPTCSSASRISGNGS